MLNTLLDVNGIISKASLKNFNRVNLISLSEMKQFLNLICSKAIDLAFTN